MKKILIIGGIHGDEIPSIFIAQEIKEWVKESKIKNVDIIPRVNSYAISNGLRKDPRDDKDLNRVFPGKKNGTPSEKIAYNIFQKCKKYDIVIDLHTYAIGRNCVPFALADFSKKFNRELAKKIGLKYSVQSSASEGQLFLELAKEGIPSILLETGSSKKVELNKIMEVKTKLINFIMGKENEKTMFIESYKKIRPNLSGKFTPNVKIGEVLPKGGLIGTINNHKIKTLKKGIVLGLFEEEDYTPYKGPLLAIGYI